MVLEKQIGEKKLSHGYIENVELVLLIVLLGLLFDYTNGFHDAANVVSTVIATRVLTPLAAISMAAILNFLGATQISGVAQTVASGVVSAESASQAVVLSAIAGAIAWNLATWYFGLPSSSSYALIGGLLGAAITHTGPQTVLWHSLAYKVLIPMILSPLFGCGIGYLLMRGLRRWVSAKRHASPLFSRLQIGSSCLIALAHGLNDAQKSMGIITLGLFSANLLNAPEIPLWVIFACALAMGLGTASGGLRIIRTMAFSITKIDPLQGFAAETSASLVILSASLLGMPISSTHMIAGSITGVGASKSSRAVDWAVPAKILSAMAITLPGSAAIASLAYLLFYKIVYM